MHGSTPDIICNGFYVSLLLKETLNYQRLSNYDVIFPFSIQLFKLHLTISNSYAPNSANNNKSVCNICMKFNFSVDLEMDCTFEWIISISFLLVRQCDTNEITCRITGKVQFKSILPVAVACFIFKAFFNGRPCPSSFPSYFLTTRKSRHAHESCD